jgi:type IV pilus assembly protein PilY1
MLKRTTRLLAIGVMCVTAAHAEDIDLFIQGASNTATPNVLFVIDNTANWNQAFTNEIAALQNTFNNLPVNADGSAKFNVGILFANETGNPNNNVAGGYIRAAIRPMTNSTKALYATLIGNLDKLKDKGNGGYSALEMAEAYLYLSGGTPYAGTSKVKADFSANTCTGCNLTNTQIAADNAVYALGANALSSEYASRYNAPSTVGGCAKNFIIYISNGPNQESSSADSQANTMLAAGRRPHHDHSDLARGLYVQPERRVGALHEGEQPGSRHVHDRCGPRHQRPGSWLDGPAEEHVRGERGSVRRRQLEHGKRLRHRHRRQQ